MVERGSIGYGQAVICEVALWVPVIRKLEWLS